MPTFDGDVLHWAHFREQFKISIHDRQQLSESEKLVYLQQAVKNGSAKPVIEALARTTKRLSNVSSLVSIVHSYYFVVIYAR